MNKNLKRALNTTAAVSMSLAMVLGAVAPVTNVNAAWTTVTNNAIKFNSAEAFVKAFVDINSDVKEIKLTDEVVIPSGYSYPTSASKKLEDIVNVNTTDEITKTQATTNDALQYGETIKTVLEFYVDYFNVYGDEENQNYYDAALHLVGKATLGVRKTVADVTANLNTFINSLNWNTDKEISAYTDAVKAQYEEAQDYVDYVGNLVSDSQAELFNDWFEKATEAKDEYNDENNDEFVQDYIDALEELPVLTVGNTTLKVRDLVEKEEDVPYTEVAKIESFLKALKADKKLDEELKYEDVKDEAEVAEMVEGLEAIVEDMKEVKELLKSTSAAAKDYRKVDTKVDTLAFAANGKDANGNDFVASVDQAEKIDLAVTDFRASDVEKLKTYVEEVFNQFYTVTPRETSRGTYVLRLEKAEYGRYVDETVFDSGLRSLLTTTVDKNESEESYYDLLVGETASLDELYAAVTEDIEGLTLDSKITSTDAQKIIAAKKALDRLMNKDRNQWTSEASNLTYAEKKEVKSNVTLIDTLYLKLILNGEVTTIGWVETPQGWEYYDNNGKRVMEGWAPGNGYWSYMKNGYSVSNDWCAAKEGWYYMGADGKMVTGIVTIDGVDYNFGTDGIWVR